MTGLNRQLELILAIADGKTPKEIAFEWDRSLKTVEFHWAKTKQQFGFHTYVDAAKYAIKHHMYILK